MKQMPNKISNDTRRELFWKRMEVVTGILVVILIIMLFLTPIILGINHISNKQPENTFDREVSFDQVDNNCHYDISYQDKVIMAKVVFAEASIESFECKVAVAAVILNRYYSDIAYFDTESIWAVVNQPYQFASITDITMDDLKESPDCMRAVEEACKGCDPTREMFPEGALYFYAPELVTGYQKEIREGIRVLAIGTVNFHYDFEKVN